MREFNVGEPVEVRFAGDFSTEGDWKSGVVADLGAIEVMLDGLATAPHQTWVAVHPEDGMCIFLVPNAEYWIRRKNNVGS